MNNELRAFFPITEHKIYLNHAAVSPPPRPSIEAVKAQLDDVAQNGSLNFRDWIATKTRARRLVAGMIGARPEQVAFMRNTSDGLSTVAQGLKWKQGDNIVTFRNEFPSNVYPWLNIRDAYGVEVRMCAERDGRIDLDELIALIDHRTRILALSYVQYASGFRADIARLGQVARKVDALFVVDAIQGLGVIPLDAEDQSIDIVAASSHKWLLAPEGVGILFMSDRARSRIEPTLVGWVSVPNPEEYNNFEQGWSPGALAWETGTGPAALFYGLEASVKILLETGIPAIESYLRDLTDHLCERLASRDLKNKYRVVSSRVAGEKSQIVCLESNQGLSSMSLYKHLKERDIITAPRGTRLRIAPHFYNTVDDIEELIKALP